MSLAERVDTRGTNKQGLPCSVAELLASLPDDEAAAFKAMLDAPWRVWGHQRIEDVVAEEGHYTLGKGAVGKHRRRTCRCSRQS